MKSNDLNTLVSLSLLYPIELARFHKSFKSFSSSEIESFWMFILKNGLTFHPSRASFKVHFSLEEDYILCDFINSHPGSFPPESHMNSLIKSPFFFPSKTKLDLITRYQEISGLSDLEKESIVKAYARELAKYSFLFKVGDTPMFQCLPSSNGFLSDEMLVDQSFFIEKEKSLLNDIKFQASSIALLRNEFFQFFMTQQAIIIGRSKMANINLTPFLPSKCHHVSRTQAILSFLSNGKFCLENVGQRAFRVNGTLVYPLSCCTLSPFSILDFSDVLFVFIPNPNFLENFMRRFS